MTELELYKFCKGKELDWRGDKLILWIEFLEIKEFTELLGYDFLSEGGLDVVLFEFCIALELNDLCEHFEIEPENILKKSE